VFSFVLDDQYKIERRIIEERVGKKKNIRISEREGKEEDIHTKGF